MGLEELTKSSRIDYDLAVKLAYSSPKKLNILCQIDGSWYKSKSKMAALDNARHLGHLLLLIKEQRPTDLDEFWKKQTGKRPFTLYAKQERDLFENIVTLASYPEYREWIYSLPANKIQNFARARISDEKSKEKEDYSQIDTARAFISMLKGMPDSDSSKDAVKLGAFRSFSLGRLALDVSLDYCKPSDSRQYHFRDSTPDYDYVLLNGNVEVAINNELKGTCFGPNGDSRDAPVTYWLDPAFHLLSFSHGPFYLKKSAFGLGIFFEAEGYHASSPDNPLKYLVLEGFPASEEDYRKISKFRQVGENEKRTIIMGSTHSDPINRSKNPHFSVGEFTYLLGLHLASLRNIPKLFINVKHSGNQFSVEDVVREIAEYSRLDEDFWHKERRKSFRLLKDPKAKSELSVLTDPYNSSNVVRTKNGDSFSYTHLLAKKPLPPDVMEKIRLGGINCTGEVFLDTFFPWNKFLSECSKETIDLLKQKHPYAESVLKRAESRRSQGLDPESYWNFGIGYCTGFEVDVKAEFERLGIKMRSK